MARLSADPKNESGATGSLGYNYLLSFMQQENRTKDDAAKLLRFSSRLKYTRNGGKLQDCVSDSVRLISEFEADKFVKLE
eukprot:6233962-Pyramimonas_sp.AAC.1